VPSVSPCNHIVHTEIFVPDHIRI